MMILDYDTDMNMMRLLNRVLFKVYKLTDRVYCTVYTALYTVCIYFESGTLNTVFLYFIKGEPSDFQFSDLSVSSRSIHQAE